MDLFGLSLYIGLSGVLWIKRLPASFCRLLHERLVVKIRVVICVGVRDVLLGLIDSMHVFKADMVTCWHQCLLNSQETCTSTEKRLAWLRVFAYHFGHKHTHFSCYSLQSYYFIAEYRVNHWLSIIHNLHCVGHSLFQNIHSLDQFRVWLTVNESWTFQLDTTSWLKNVQFVRAVQLWLVV